MEDIKKDLAEPPVSIKNTDKGIVDSSTILVGFLGAIAGLLIANKIAKNPNNFNHAIGIIVGSAAAILIKKQIKK